jgi:pimeloyl-ACP methyl ester carboxylesterase
VVAVPLAVAALLLINAVSVGQQQASATWQPSLTVGGEQIHVTQDGPRDGPALVLIHGFSASTRSWDLLVPMLAERHHVIRIDLPGHGWSAKPTGAGYAIADQGRRVGEVLDQSGVRRAIVVGHSTGGSVATALAEQRRDLVPALALINTGPSGDAFIPHGPVRQLLQVPVAGQLLWRLRATLGTPLLLIFGSEDRRWRSSSAADYRAVPGGADQDAPRRHSARDTAGSPVPTPGWNTLSVNRAGLFDPGAAW